MNMGKHSHRVIEVGAGDLVIPYRMVLGVFMYEDTDSDPESCKYGCFSNTGQRIFNH